MKHYIVVFTFLAFSFQTLSCQNHITSADVIGVWEGTFQIPNQPVRIVYKISVGRDGKYSAFQDNPDYPLLNVPVHTIALDGDHLSLSVGLYDSFFEGTVGSNVIKGRFRTNGPWLPLTLHRKSTDPHYVMDYMVPRTGKFGERVWDYQYNAPESLDDGWEVEDAVHAGMDTAAIGTLLRRVLAGDFPNLHSLVVVKDGKIVVEEYFHQFAAGKPHQIASIAKVISAAAVGLAYDRGLIRNLHTPLVEFFPEYKDILDTDAKRSITLHHLLTMTTGIQWNEHALSYLDPRNDLSVLKKSPDRLRAYFERPMAYPPGTQFVYCSGAMLVLEELVTRVTKDHFLMLVQNEMFTPMGIINYHWDFMDGYQMTPRDLAKLGRLYSDSGMYAGTRILSRGWIDSALQRFHPNVPKYFNHWWPLTYFVDGVPIQALAAGGWGGQSITIFPSLNTMTVMTGANQLQYADYDVCVRNYVLPAILTKEFRAAHPAHAYDRIRQLKTLQWEMHWDTEIGCLKSAALYYGLPISNALLYGATGVGFLINIDETAAAKGMAVWHKGRFYELCRDLGLQVESIWSHKSGSDFPAMQKQVWDRVRRSIDSGQVCYGFQLEAPIRTLVFGYDDCGYYFKGWEAEEGRGPVVWDDLGKTDIGLLGMHFVRPVKTEIPFPKLVKEALQFVLEFSAGSPNYVPRDCKAGPDGFNRWIELLETGGEDEYGVSFNAIQFMEARTHAVEFLEEAKRRLPPTMAPLFDDAIGHYKVSARNLGLITLVLPHTVPSAQRAINIKDKKLRAAAIGYLRAARDAEIEGLKALKEIAGRL